MARGPEPKDQAELTGDADSAWQALSAALATKKPPCIGESRFIPDELSQPQQAELAVICAGCPILSQCSDFAGQVAPYRSAGFWAGSSRGRHARGDYKRRREVAA
ncbi:WhiB family transcriptional regulator [Microbacterium stercoris]|uniref:4Fe-4S Wbl-type domain-containing protein n=1 Tax=Microbacterium stercoris TaxID=2820289 RepID=A0A939QJI7_9MICO|nr:WhiB family transcriptional regulator [Microbacterium stercoris]MBO3664068.1 hypothetical protein [Microbacterium stercoris]